MQYKIQIGGRMYSLYYMYNIHCFSRPSGDHAYNTYFCKKKKLVWSLLLQVMMAWDSRW